MTASTPARVYDRVYLLGLGQGDHSPSEPTRGSSYVRTVVSLLRACDSEDHMID